MKNLVFSALLLLVYSVGFASSANTNPTPFFGKITLSQVGKSSTSSIALDFKDEKSFQQFDTKQLQGMFKDSDGAIHVEISVSKNSDDVELSLTFKAETIQDKDIVSRANDLKKAAAQALSIKRPSTKQ
jgi:hypothetical protein